MTESLMEYIPTPEGAGDLKYVGDVADMYEAKRMQSPKWQVEQSIVESMLEDLPPGSLVLDAPCGTGRFFEFYVKKGFGVRALDLSQDMLQIARTKPVNFDNFQFACRSILDTSLEDKSIDASVMVRLTRWLSPEQCQLALKELQRVTSGRIIFTHRTDPKHPHVRPLELFTSVSDKWKVHRDEAGHEEEYRIVEMRPV